MPSPPVNPSSPAISESLRGNYEPDIGTPETDEPSEPGRPLSPDPDYLPSEDTGMPDVLHIETLQTAQKFIDELRNSTLEDTGLSDKAIHRLRNPPRAPPIDLSNDESLRQSLDLWVTLSKAAENVYDSVNTSIHRNMGVEVLSKDSLERKINEMTGLYPQRDDMCIDTCAAFTGPFANDDICPVCKKARYDEVIDSDGKRTNKPRKQFLTNPIGPLIQAAWASKESAREMSYRKNATPAVVEEYHARNGSVESLTDWIHGSDYIEAVNRGHIDADTTTLTLSLDGAQLYHNKQSDCWIYIWILMDRSPESRYKKPHMVVGGIIPGPNKPKNVDSFLFPGFQHVAALMKEGLTIWDASQDRVFRSKVFLAYVTADGPGMQFVNGLVGHSGRYGCRLYCPVRGRRKKNSGHYYPALLKPDPPYDISGCTHDDIDPYDVPRRPQDEAAARYRRNLIQVASATNTTRYEKERLETGIAKMSLVSGLPADCILGIPNCFPPDIMHLSALNIPDLLISLWRATLTCEEPDNKDTWDWAIFRDADAWKAHGLAVSAASLLLPGSFDRLPRNIAEKLTSGYKAVEFLTYMYGLAPALLYGVLPEKYWRHHCKLVRGIRLVYQRQVTKDQIIEAHQLLTEYEEEFEKLYYQRASTRIHFVRQSIHALLHIGPGTFQFGPYSIFSQFPLERIIGDLGRDIRQDSNPYANLAMIAERRCMLNALIHIYPQFMPPPPLFPQYSTPLGDGYALLRKRERFPSAVASDAEAVALRQFFATSEDIRASNEWLAKPSIARWARLRLPCGQTARSRWKDGRSTLMNPPRPSRHIKVCILSFCQQRGLIDLHSYSLCTRVCPPSPRCSITSSSTLAKATTDSRVVMPWYRYTAPQMPPC